MASPPTHLRIAPRVILHDLGTPPPAVQPGELALARIRASPGARVVFGDGRHPTTRLCAGALDLLCRRQPGAAVLDVGTGTGVLARIARARGAGLVVATDIDPEALASAQAHAALDAHPRPIHFSAATPDLLADRFDLVVANILEGPLRALAPALRATLRPQGRLLLGGITAAQMPGMHLACEQAGLACTTAAQLEGWVLLGCKLG